MVRDQHLREAAERGDVATVERVLMKGPALVNASCGRTGWTALHSSADRGRLNVLKVLLAVRADPGLRTARGATALALASASGHTECVKALLDAGADPAQAAGRSDRTALHGAMRLNRPEVVRALVACGADPDRSSLSGVTARELGGAVSTERYTWQNHTATKILGDPFYLSAAELEQYPPLDDVLHSGVYAAEAQQWAAESVQPQSVPSAPVAGKASPADVPMVHEDAESDPQTAALAAALAAEAEVAKVEAERKQAEVAEAQKAAKEAAEANAARLLAAVEHQRVVEMQEVERRQKAEEKKRQARFDRLKAESSSRAAALLGLFEPDEQPRNTRMETLWDAAKTAAAERESRATSDAAAMAAEQHIPGQADTSTPREPPPVDASTAAASPPRVDTRESAPVFDGQHVPDDSPPVLFPSTSMTATTQQHRQHGTPFDGPTVSIVLVKGDRVTLAQGAPAIFNLKPGRCDRAPQQPCVDSSLPVVSTHSYFTIYCFTYLISGAYACRQGVIVAVSKKQGDATPFKVQADDTGRTGWYGRSHLAHA
jgi:hypothetical protein